VAFSALDERNLPTGQNSVLDFFLSKTIAD